MKTRLVAPSLRRITLAAALLAASASPALAQKSKGTAQYRTSGDAASYEVAFTDDDVLYAGWSAYGDFLAVHPPAKRAGLLRPRTSFVPEMLKSALGL